MSTSNQNNASPTTAEPLSLLDQALSSLPTNKPIIFTNLLRFHKTAQYPSTTPKSICTRLPEPPTSTTGEDAYWTRYFPIYHQATRDTLGNDADKLQRVIYKGTPLMPLRFARRGRSTSKVTEDVNETGQREDEGYWHAVVMTWVESWEVVKRISENELYTTVGTFHRDAAVQDDELFVSCAVDGFEMAVMS
jgi:hypothetical protein